jgi:hypothetical protein
MRRHAKWVREAYGVRDVDRPSGLNAGLLLSEQRLFADSTSSLGLQLADMLATVLRRALNNRLQSTGWENYGRLLLADKSSTPILQLGPAPQSGRTQILKGQRIEKVWRALNSGNKPMLVPQKVWCQARSSCIPSRRTQSIPQPPKKSVNFTTKACAS